MKIYYISNARIPTEKAHGIQIMRMCEALRRSGADIELVLPRRRNPNFFHVDARAYYSIHEKFPITKLFIFDPLFLMRFPQGVYIKFESAAFLLSTYIFLKKKKISSHDILYAREEYLLPLLLRFCKNVVWEAHTLPRRKEMYARFWKRCHAIIVLTKYLREDLIRLGVEPRKIFVAPDGVDLNFFQAQKSAEELKNELHFPTDKKIVLYSGHLYEWKGAGVLGRAAAFLPKEFFLVFIGGMRHDYEQFKKEFGGKPNIRIVGHKPPAEVRSYMHASDILVIPNSAKSEISRRYTSPLKFFEYLSTPKPIVASDLPSLRDIGERFPGIWYFRPDDPKDLARALKECLGQNTGFHRDLRPFTWEKRAENILSFLRSSSL